jgi:hypothetical protein
VAGCCENGNELSGSIKGRKFLLVTISFSKRTLLHGVGWMDGWSVSRLVSYIQLIYVIVLLYFLMSAMSRNYVKEFVYYIRNCIACLYFLISAMYRKLC